MTTHNRDLKFPCRLSVGLTNGIVAIAITGMLLLSCKKDDRPVEELDPRREQIQRNLDSIYRYAQQIYLWHTQLPPLAQFDPARFYSSTGEEIESYRQEIFELTRFATDAKAMRMYELNPLDPRVPKYSTIVPPAADDKMESAQVDVNNAFGMSFHHDEDGIRILYVDPNSPAGKSGVKRGDRLVAVDDQTIGNSTVFNALLKAALKKSYIKIVFLDQVGKSRQVRLTASNYELNPLLKHTVITTAGRKIGFMAYNSFTDEENTGKYLDPVFETFARENISELIVDLRYNGGGYQNTVTYLANHIAPDKANGKIMFTEHYNELMQAGKADILRNQFILGWDQQPIYVNGKKVSLYDIDYGVAANTVRFTKKTGLGDLRKIYFIVSPYTASSSELLINVLRPYADIRLIGVSSQGDRQVSTYGKPVGFFDIDINGYKLYIALYQDKNAVGDGDYYEGMRADYSTLDDPRHDFGSLGDPAVQAAINQSFGASAEGRKALAPHSGRGAARYHFNNDRLQGSIKEAKDFKLKSGRY